MRAIQLPVKPISQLFPIPMLMGCEGVSAAMILQYNHIDVKATKIMKHWPKHPNNPRKGYVGHQSIIKLGHHQTIFPTAFVPYLRRFTPQVKDSSGTSLTELEDVLKQGQPVVIYPTSRAKRPVKQRFKIDHHQEQLVSNIHITVLTGFDDTYYYYVDPLWAQLCDQLHVPAIFPGRLQRNRIPKAQLQRSFDAAGRMSFYIDAPSPR